MLPALKQWQYIAVIQTVFWGRIAPQLYLPLQLYTFIKLLAAILLIDIVKFIPNQSAIDRHTVALLAAFWLMDIYIYNGNNVLKLIPSI